MIRRNRLNKFTLLTSLYVSQYISLMFFAQALPIFMRQQGTSLESVGLIYLLIGFPLLLKMFWAPFIDRYGYTPWGHYRFWIVFFQFPLAVLVILCAFLDIKTDFPILLFLLFLSAALASSQDIATDALAVNLLKPNERGWGNGIQMAGNYLGSILGGGVMLIFLNQWGWKKSLFSLALLLILALFPILNHREVQTKSVRSDPPFGDLLNFYRRKGIWPWLLVLTLYMTGGNMANAMFRPLLVDTGLSLAEIGWLLGVVGNGAAILGAVVAGVLTIPLGRKRSLIGFGVFQVIAILTYLLPASGIDNWFILYFVTILMHFAISATLTGTSIIMMDKSNPETAGTDYTAQTSLVYLGGFIAAGVSGVIASAIGYQGLFLVSGAIALLSVILVAKTFQSVAAIAKSA